MKTLALIKNELFKDYVKIVSTDDLEKSLDNPDVPVPFTCIDSVQNTNSDLLLTELSSYFQQSKVKNKDLFILDKDANAQLAFMLNLIKLSSNQNIEKLSFVSSPKIEIISEQQPVLKYEPPIEFIYDKVENSVDTNIIAKDETISNVEEDLDDPFKISTKILNKNETISPELINTTDLQEKKEEVVESIQEIISKVTPEVTKNVKNEDTTELFFGIPKNSQLTFLKDENITATLLDNKNVLFNGEILTFVEAAKQAFKNKNSLGMPSLSSWLYNGTSLKLLKEKSE